MLGLCSISSMATHTSVQKLKRAKTFSAPKQCYLKLVSNKEKKQTSKKVWIKTNLSKVQIRQKQNSDILGNIGNERDDSFQEKKREIKRLQGRRKNRIVFRKYLVRIQIENGEQDEDTFIYGFPN